MTDIFALAALWLGLALVATLLSIWPGNCRVHRHRRSIARMADAARMVRTCAKTITRQGFRAEASVDQHLQPDPTGGGTAKGPA